MKKVFDEEFHERYYLQVGSYYNSNRLAITVCKDNDEYVEDITVNQPLVELKDDNQILLSNHISNGVKYLLLDRGIISKTSEIKEYGNIKYQVVNVDLEKLKEYDKEGVESFLEKHEGYKETMESTVTTLSGTYTVEEYHNLVENMKNAYKSAWRGVIPYEKLEELKKTSGLSQGEISSLQYDASLEYDKEKNSTDEQER